MPSGDLTTLRTLAQHALERTPFDTIEDELGIARGGLIPYLRANPDQMRAYFEGVASRDVRDEQDVESAVLKRIRGYDIETERRDPRTGAIYTDIQHFPPDGKLGMEWLERRDKERWGKQQDAAPGTVTNVFINSQVQQLQAAGLR